jgi:hypothetical protein
MKDPNEEARDEVEPRAGEESAEEDLSKETLADLDTTEEAAEDAKGGGTCPYSKTP